MSRVQKRLTWADLQRQDLRPVRTTSHPPRLLTEPHPEVLQPRPAHQRSSNETTTPPQKKESATPVLERVLLTASKWEQAVGG